MKKYSFRLQTLLKIRELYEEQAERDFRIALQDLTSAVEVLDELRSRLAQTTKELNQVRQKRLDVSVHMLYDEYCKWLRERLQQQLLAVAAAEREVERYREVLLEKMKERKAIEKLRMRDYDRYLQELRRFEQGVIDDLGTLQGGRGESTELGGVVH